MKTAPPPHLPLFRSDQQARILTEIYLNADGGRSLADLSKATGTSSGGAHKEVERLEQAGLVRSTRVGRTRLVTPNTESPYHAHLRALLLKAFGPTTLLRRSLPRLTGIEEGNLATILTPKVATRRASCQRSEYDNCETT